MPHGLLARTLLILLAVVATEFAATTFLFERSQHFALQDDEAQRLADHLSVAHRLLDRAAVTDRPRLTRELDTQGFDIEWAAQGKATPDSFRLNQLRDQVLHFAPELTMTRLKLYVPPISSGASLAGSIDLSDGSVMTFRAKHGSVAWSLTLGGILALLAPTLVLVVMGMWMIQRLFRPLGSLIRATQEVGVDDAAPVPEQGPNELRALIHAFNAMQARIQRLIQARTQALVAVTHDLRTPLARLRLRLDQAKLDEDTRETMSADIAELTGLLQSLQDYLGGGNPASEAQSIDLAAMAQTIIDNARDSGGNASYRGPDSLVITAHAVSLRRALTNLVDNALHYGGKARLTLGADAEGIILTVEDNGPGIPEDQLETVLQPFVRGDTARARNTGGMGLGLAIVRDTVRREGGTLTLANRAEGGLCAAIRLPLSQS